MLGVKRARSAVQNWAHKAHLQPDEKRGSDHVALDGTVIRPDDQQYWLSAAFGTEPRKLPHTTLGSTRYRAIAGSLFRERRETPGADVDGCLVDGDRSLDHACRRHDLGFEDERYGIERCQIYLSSSITMYLFCFELFW